MNIITAYPVYHMNREKGQQKRLDDNLYYNLDSSSNSAQIQAFQDWMDIKHPGWVNGKSLNKNASGGYGTFGPSTTAAWNSYGNDFMAGLAGVAGVMGMDAPTSFGSPSANPAPKGSGKSAAPVTPVPSDGPTAGGASDPAAQAVVDSMPKSGMNKKKKVLIISAAALVMLIIVIVVAKSKSSK